MIVVRVSLVVRYAGAPISLPGAHPLADNGLRDMKILLDNLPLSLQDQAETLRQCLLAFDQVMPLQAVYLFGSHARGEARPDSDVDLCLVSESAERPLAAAVEFRRAIRGIRPKPAFTLVPIMPARLREKRQKGDHFFHTVLQESIPLGA